MMFKPNTECFEVNRKFFIYKLNSFWQLLYYHDFSKERAWSSVDEARRSYKSDKYSVLYSINPKYKINGKYEFLLEYPEHDGFNQWSQTSNPLEEIEIPGDGSQNAEGYKEISCTWKSDYFGGLVRSSSNTLTLLDGSSYHENTYYSIGRTSAMNNGVPGPGIIVQKSQLWMKVNNPYPRLCSLKAKRKSINHIFCLVFLLTEARK